MGVGALNPVEIGGHRIDPHGFRSALITWGRRNQRYFPWRQTRDPYRILVAEVMLHRTQAPQVVPVYERFVVRYPDVDSLAGATNEELQDVLASLGLRWRIDLMHEMAVQMVDQYGGRVPRSRSHLLSLAGVSQYIAGAVRCFAWGMPEPLLDTNTVRVMGRLFGLAVKDSSRRSRTFGQLAEALVDPRRPRLYNYALLDLAGGPCSAKPKPGCGHCPVRGYCRQQATDGPDQRQRIV